MTILFILFFLKSYVSVSVPMGRAVEVVVSDNAPLAVLVVSILPAPNVKLDTTSEVT